MDYLQSYKKLNKLVLDESFEPVISWGMRMAISGTIPVLWGLATGKAAEAVWIAIGAEAVSWVELKGAFAWRVRTLVTAAMFTVLFSGIGMVTGFNILLTILSMFGVAFLATLLKSIGDRASGLAICVYMSFIFSNANPDTKLWEVKYRLIYIGIGALVAVLSGVIASVLAPAQQPYRRHIALIFKAIGALVETISGRNATTPAGKSPPDLFEKEKDVRVAIDSSLNFFGKFAHQVSRKDNQHYQLAQVRKSASLVAVNVMAMADEMEYIRRDELDESLRLKAAALYWALEEAVNRMAVFVLSLKPEEKLLITSQTNRIRKLSRLIQGYDLPPNDPQTKAILRILHLAGRCTLLLQNVIRHMDAMGKDKPVFKSYSYIKTSFVLKPKYLLRNIRTLFSFNSRTARYALRSAIAATVAMVIYKGFHVDHGYWLPFSVMIVIQPYFGATFKKAIDRVVGTIGGGIAGSLLLHIPADLHVKEFMLFVTFVLMVYYMKRNYAIAVFSITLNLVLLFHIEAANLNMVSLMFTRALCTTGGAALAVISGFALLPVWDKKWLPLHLANAISSNLDYFNATFFLPDARKVWTKYKLAAELKNTDVFDSFSRYKDDPGKDKTMTYYELITHNVRITRNLNNINTEQDEKKYTVQELPAPSAQNKMNECIALFQQLLKAIEPLKPGISAAVTTDYDMSLMQFSLNEAQLSSLEKIIIELKTMLLMM